jgi:Right handed beta helix region
VYKALLRSASVVPFVVLLSVTQSAVARAACDFDGRLHTCIPSGTPMFADTSTGPTDASTTSSRPGAPAALGAGAGAKVTYYVDDVDGDDGRSGRSPSSAWRTLRRASAAHLNPGDRLLLKRGGSWAGTLTITSSGTSQQPITIGAFGRGARPLLTTHGCVHLDGSYLVARHLHAANCDWSGFYVGGDRVRVTQSTASRNVAGIQVGYTADRSILSRNRLMRNNRLSDGNGQFGILINGTNTTVFRNSISGSDGAGVEIYGGSSLNGGARVHHNILRTRVFSEMGKTRANSLYYNVLISPRDEAKGLVMHGPSTQHGPVSGTRFFNNSVYLPGRRSQGWVCTGACDETSLTLRNNIFLTTWKGGYADGPVDEDYNLYFGHRILQFSKGSHSFVRRPRFVAAPSGNLRLRRSSPAIDRGVATMAVRDMDGFRVPFRITKRRPGVDRGAYEYH